MNESLPRWMADADALWHIDHLAVKQVPIDYAHVRNRAGDYYISLVGDLFDRMRNDSVDAAAWAKIGNAFAQLAARERESQVKRIGVARSTAVLYGAAAFYCGGYPASAYLTINENEVSSPSSERYKMVFDLLARPHAMTSETGRSLLKALRLGAMNDLSEIHAIAQDETTAMLRVGADEWVTARLFEKLLERFMHTNVRVVLPGGATAFWDPFVKSLLDRKPPTWEFFPSQIDAISRGLLTRSDTFSLQMPTGAGKTALCETLLYWHAKRTLTDVAVLVVPYRSLASELRGTVVKRLNAMGIAARCAYGGTVPSGDEVNALEHTRVIVATPESLSGLLGADSSFLARISLVICDEGHLLDGGARGISLELLLARFRSRGDGPPRFVFISAIVPNIEEINAWLGGASDTVVRSDYRPALAEFAVLRGGDSAGSPVSLEMHPHEVSPTRYSIGDFLSKSDFQWHNKETGRFRTYPFKSIKTRAIASARKALGMGAAVVFAANKRGNQGAVGLAEELLNQLAHELPLPLPLTFMSVSEVSATIEYLRLEYGEDWIGTRTVSAGAVLHHGDIPQETREVLEALLRQQHVRFAICTSTLAEGVNLPIRTLVLYSVQRRQKAGPPVDLLSRDIKNLVGRAGRAGTTTKGLVICANERQWPLVATVARQDPGEVVHGSLRSLLGRLRSALVAQHLTLSNELMEGAPALHALVDGVDATLVDLATEEIGEDALVAHALELANQTFASTQAEPDTRALLGSVFALRARRIFAVRAAGRLGWIRETGARVRLLDAVESDLVSRRQNWDDIQNPIEPGFVSLILDWAWKQSDMQRAVREAYQLDDDVLTNSVQQSFTNAVNAWLQGARFREIAAAASLDLDDLLGVHGRVIAFVLQTLVEQGVALLVKLLESSQRQISPAVLQFPEQLRFGVPTSAAQVLAAGGIRHRSAAVEIGNARGSAVGLSLDKSAIFAFARTSLTTLNDAWVARLGSLVYLNTIADLSGPTSTIEEGV